LPAGFVGFGAEGLFLTPTGGEDAVGGKAKADEIFLDGVGAALAESEIVLGGAALVAVALDGDAGRGIIFQEVGGLLKSGAGVGANFGGVVIEVGVTDFLEEEFVEAGFGSFRGGRRRVDGDANGGVRGTAGSGSGEGVGGGVRWGDGGGALRSDSADFGSDGDAGGVGGGPRELDGITFGDGGAVGGDGGGGLGRGRWRLCSGWSGGYALLAAASDKENEGGKRDKQRASKRAVRLSHACPPRHRKFPCRACWIRE